MRRVWENSWVRFPLADLKIGERGQVERHRADSLKFTFEQTVSATGW